MCDILHNLVYERTDDISVLSNFYCGIPEMDYFIHNELEKRLRVDEKLDFFLVKRVNDVVALVAVKQSYVEFNIQTGKQTIDSLEIEYLAVRKDKQKNHIGTQIIDWIENNMEHFFSGTHIISVRAYRDFDMDYSAVPFYKSCGFRVIAEKHPLANNVIMAKRI